MAFRGAPWVLPSFACTKRASTPSIGKQQHFDLISFSPTKSFFFLCCVENSLANRLLATS